MEYTIYKTEIVNRRFDEYKELLELPTYESLSAAENAALSRINDLGPNECYNILEWNPAIEDFSNSMIRIERDKLPIEVKYNPDKWRM